MSGDKFDFLGQSIKNNKYVRNVLNPLPETAVRTIEAQANAVAETKEAAAQAAAVNLAEI